MNAVIEIYEIGQAMNFNPLNRFIAAIALANGLKVCRSVEENRMAIHAGLCRRNAGDGGSFHSGMTVTAVDAVIADEMFVAELHGLLTRNILPRHVGRARYRQNGHKRQSDQE